MKEHIAIRNKQGKCRCACKRIFISLSVAIALVLAIAGISALMRPIEPLIDGPDTVRLSAEFQSALDEFQRKRLGPIATRGIS